MIYLDPALLLNPVPCDVCRLPFCGGLREFCVLQVGVVGLLGLLLQGCKLGGLWKSLLFLKFSKLQA